MSPLILHPINWQKYSLIDTGEGKKLEKFGPYLIVRPEPQAIWPKRLSDKLWLDADAN